MDLLHFMTKPAKPLPVKTVLALGIAMAVAFSLLSFFFLFMQARNAGDRIVGAVVAIEQQNITIINGRGQKTTLIVPEDAHLRNIDTIADISLGQRLMIRGSFVDDATFRVEGLRVFKD